MGLLLRAERHRCCPPKRGLWRATDSVFGQDVEVGSIWQCDECQTYWEAQQEPPFTQWYPISARKARRRLRSTQEPTP